MARPWFRPLVQIHTFCMETAIEMKNDKKYHVVSSDFGPGFSWLKTHTGLADDRFCGRESWIYKLVMCCCREHSSPKFLEGDLDSKTVAWFEHNQIQKLLWKTITPLNWETWEQNCQKSFRNHVKIVRSHPLGGGCLDCILVSSHLIVIPWRYSSDIQRQETHLTTSLSRLACSDCTNLDPDD